TRTPRKIKAHSAKGTRVRIEMPTETPAIRTMNRRVLRRARTGIPMPNATTGPTIAIGRINTITVIGSAMIETLNAHDCDRGMIDRETEIGIGILHAVAKHDATCVGQIWGFGSTGHLGTAW